MLRITVNGEPRSVAPGTSVAMLLDSTPGCARDVAVELNQAVVARSDYAHRQLQNGDVVEIVAFVGGG